MKKEDFEKSIEKLSHSPEKIKELIKYTVWHEIAHHFGFAKKTKEFEYYFLTHQSFLYLPVYSKLLYSYFYFINSLIEMSSVLASSVAAKTSVGVSEQQNASELYLKQLLILFFVDVYFHLRSLYSSHIHTASKIHFYRKTSILLTTM